MCSPVSGGRGKCLAPSRSPRAFRKYSSSSVSVHRTDCEETPGRADLTGPTRGQPLLTFLERHCALCSHAVVNQQDWRRHMKKCHDLEWISAQAGISSTLEGIELSRPCKFCRIAYTKTPRLHTAKCLPLLQLSFLRHHVRDLSSDVGGANIWGAHSPMNEDQSDDELQPTKFPKKAGKGAGKLEKTAPEPQAAPPRGPKQAHLLTLARMMARQEMALQQLEADRSWVIFVDSGGLGIINQLMLTTATWKKQRSKNEVLLQPQTSPYGGNAHGARSEDGQTGRPMHRPRPR